MLALVALIEIAAAQPTASPAPAAPPAPTDTLRQAVIDAIRNCPHGEDGAIIVCSRDRGVAEGYRIPRLDPRFATNLRASGRGELPAPPEAATGVGSCSKVGAGGATGCAKKDIDVWGAWKRDKKEKSPEDQAFPW
jgi:hypothetical protein